MISDRMRPTFAVLLTLAWALVAAWLLTSFWTSAATAITDPDDAMRLVQVREFLAGKGWFDLNEPRLNVPYGYLTHWSRLVDLGLAGLFLLARVFCDPTTAERVMLEVWPVLWLLPAIGGAAAIAWRCGGRDAALVTLVLAVFGLPAFQHFQPGRIDHHNVQIALAVLTIAAAVWSDRLNWAAAVAGLLSAVAMAVGLESLPWVVVTGGAIALRFVFNGESRNALRNYGVALAAGTFIAFAINTSPAQWFVPACDALAINLALPAIAGGLPLMLVARACTSRAMRFAGVAVCGLVAAGIFAGIEPRCLGGPFAMVDPAVRPIWLAEVRKMEPLARLMGSSPVVGIWVAAFPSFALICVLWLLSRAEKRKDFGIFVAIAALVIAVVLTISVVKAYSYAMWFAMPVVAIAASSFFARFEIRRPLRWASALVVIPVMISGGAVSFAQASNPPVPAKLEACFKIAPYDALQKLPSGLIAADVDLGPLLLAFSHHAVLAAPYHRISSGIVTVHRALASPPEEARKTLLEARANYVVLCGVAKPMALDGVALRDGLWTQLAANEIPAWLERVPMPEGNPLVVYRVKL